VDMVQLTYKFRLYPTKQQEEKLLWTLDKCRFIYNYLLDKKQKEKLRRKELQALLPKLKEEFPELKEVHSKTLQYENYRLHSNILASHKLKNKGKKVGKLRFKGKDWFKTFVYNQSGFKIIKNSTRYDKLLLSKIGEISFVMHREIKGKIKQVTIKKYPSGKWFASIAAEINEEILETKNTKKVGIDLGVTNYVYDTDGSHFDNPKTFDRSLKKLRKEQRRLSRKKKKSKNRMKQKIKIAMVHEKIVNQRDDFLHKLSGYYVNNYGFIAVEDLKILNMVKNRYISKSILDASWSRFIQMLQYKAERAGVEVVKVEPKGTTQMCSNCGKEIYKKLWNRKHICECGLKIDRDHNSAINILKRALGQELPEFTPVEIEPLPARASLVKEAGSSLR
jgi:putative transposase